MPLSPLGGTLDTAPAFATPTFDITPRPLSSVSAPNLATGAKFSAGDRVKDTCSVTSSLVTLAKANPVGFNNFKDGVGDGNYCFYCLADSAGNWEAQYGLYSDAAGTLTRATAPLASSTSPGAQVTFSGPVTVFGNDPAALIMAPWPGMAAGRISTNAYSAYGGGNANVRAGLVLYAPVVVPQPFSAVTLYFSLSTAAAGSSVTLGLYSNLNGAPYALLGQQSGLNTGSGSVTGANATSLVAMPSPMPPGLYWVAYLASGGAPTVAAAFGSARPAVDVFGKASNSLTAAPALAWSQPAAGLPLIASGLTAEVGGNVRDVWIGAGVTF